MNIFNPPGMLLNAAPSFFTASELFLDFAEYVKNASKYVKNAETNGVRCVARKRTTEKSCFFGRTTSVPLPAAEWPFRFCIYMYPTHHRSPQHRGRNPPLSSCRDVAQTLPTPSNSNTPLRRTSTKNQKNNKKSQNHNLFRRRICFSTPPDVISTSKMILNAAGRYFSTSNMFFNAAGRYFKVQYVFQRRK